MARPWGSGPGHQRRAGRGQAERCVHQAVDVRVAPARASPPHGGERPVRHDPRSRHRAAEGAGWHARTAHSARPRVVV